MAEKTEVREEVIEIPDLSRRVVEKHELVDGKDAESYNAACDYPETSDYGILAEELAEKFGLEGKRVLEIGSGPGNLCQEILLRGAKRVVGLDGAKAMVAHASQKHNGHIDAGRLVFVHGSVYDLPFSSEFDLVVCQNSFHQLYHPGQALAEMVRVTESGGVALIADFRRDIPDDLFRQRVGYTKPGIRQALIDSIGASLTKQEFRDFLRGIPGIEFSVADAQDPRGLNHRVDELIRNDPVPHFRDYLISQRVEIHKI